MTRPFLQIHDAKTGESIVREMNDAEYAEWLNEAPKRESQQAASVREERNKRLKDSDWTQVSDAPVNQVVWATYRQTLRDVPSQVGFPWEIQWPIKPE